MKRGSVYGYVTEQNEEVDEARSKKDKPVAQDFLVLARKRRVKRGSVYGYVTEQNEEVDEARSKKDKPGKKDKPTGGVLWL